MSSRRRIHYFPVINCLILFLTVIIFVGGRSESAVTGKPAVTDGTSGTADTGKLELVVQTGHSQSVGVAFSPDGRLLASASGTLGSGIIKLWDMATGKEFRTLAGQSRYIRSFAFSPDGKILASGSDDGAIILWDVATGRALRSLRMRSDFVNSVTFSPNGRILAGGSSSTNGIDGMITFWDLTTGRELFTRRGEGQILSVAFSPDGKVLASISKYKTYNGEVRAIELLDTATGAKLPSSPKKRFYDIQSVVFSSDGNRIVGAAESGVFVWDIAADKELLWLKGHPSFVKSFALSADNRLLASGSGDKTIKIWEAATGKELRWLKGHATTVDSVAFSPDGKMLASGDAEGMIKLWDAGSGEELHDQSFKRHANQILAVAFSPDGKMLAAGNEYPDESATKSWERMKGDIKLWDVVTGRILRTLAGHAGSSSGVHTVAFSPDGKTLASGGGDKTIKFWDVQTGQEFRSLKGHTGSISSVTFSPDGKILASAGTGGEDGVIKLWDVAAGRELQTIKGVLLNYAKSVAFSPDGNILAIGGARSKRKEIILWDVAAGRELQTMGPFSRVETVAFSPDGQVLASGAQNGTVNLWEVATGNELRTLKGHSHNVFSVAFSLDGKIVASGSLDNTIKLWEVATGKEIVALKRHSDTVPSIAFSPDGKILASGSWDTQIKLWDPASGKELASLIAIDQSESLSATPDNYYAATRDALKGVAFRMGNRAYPFEQFDLKLNRPDIVLKRIGYAPQNLVDSYGRAYRKRLQRMNFTEEMLGNDFHLPEVAIVSRDLPLTTEEKTVQFKITARDSQYLLDRLQVFVNDVPLYGREGMNLRGKKTARLEQDIRIELTRGRNKIQVSVQNDKGVESLRETREVNYHGPSRKPALYVVAIGVSDYVNNAFDLKYAAKDANDLATLLEGKKEQFGAINVLRLLDKKATKGNILAAKELFKKSKVDDEAILFAAGHGLLDEKLDYYFAPADIDFANPSGKGLLFEEIEGLLDGIPARKKLLLVDTCHSGEVDKEETEVETKALPRGVALVNSFRGIKIAKKSENSLGLKNSSELLQELFADLRRGSGATVISSASGVEFAIESDQWKNGVFTYAVLEGLKSKNADLDKNGEIRVSELRDYVFKKVQELTNGRQTPTARRENLEIDPAIF